jgi:DNA (cytosine-5)-methyltransferase 1
LPCPPFSVAGKQLGRNDDRNLFPAMIRLVHQLRPRAASPIPWVPRGAHIE